MRIGVDIDNVLANFDDYLLEEFLKHDKTLRNKGIINKDVYITRGMFDWTKEELNSFYKENIERIAMNLKVMEGAKKYIDKLKEDGNKIFIITGRNNGDYSNPFRMTKKWLKKNKINYDKLIFTNAYEDNSKTKACLKYNVDIMIEDSARICYDLVANNIKTLIMDTPYNKNSKINRVHNWKEIYNYIVKITKEKIKVILDTDTNNECDDQFALAYLLKNSKNFVIEAITIAPYKHSSRKESIRNNLNKSYKEALKICKWLKFDIKKIYKGSSNYISSGYIEDNEAVNKIIEIASKNDKTIILAIGAITNVALAIKKRPEITERIEVIWLGGNDLKCHDNLEFNFKQDIEAVKIILNSKVKLTIIPTKNVTSKLIVSLEELKKNLSKNKLNNYLIKRFYNDGYHGIQEKRVIWDIAVVAFLVNKDWFKTTLISCPLVLEDTSYKFTNNKHQITVVENIKEKEIYKDLFRKLGE